MKGDALPPGSTIGIVGGGQLGRMLALAAAPFGYKVHIFAPDADSCAAAVADAHTQAGYDDRAALARFADSVDVVTFEFENIEAAPLHALDGHAPVFPPLAALEIGQDRIAEKTFAQDCGGRTAEWMAVESREELDTALDAVGTPAILKTSRFGYDGKGQVRIRTATDAHAAWEELGGKGVLILEAMVPFQHEFSMLVARDRSGHVAFWDAPENVHRDGILHTSTVPADREVEQQMPAARALARKIADKLDYVGVFAIEFFCGADGPVFNEMAPRVHNSGHWTIEGAVASQFENHIRAVAGLPLGSTTLTGKSVVMTNLIGADALRWEELAADLGSHLHLYGKGEARPGRKMGHVTRVTR